MIKKKTFFGEERFSLPKFLSMFFILFGLVFLLSNVIKRIQWEKTNGTVKEVLKKTDKNQFYPLVQFETIFEGLVEVEIHQSSNRFFYGKGDEIPIIYPKEDYKKAKINSTGWMFGFPCIFILVGIIAFLIPKELWQISNFS